MNPRDEKLELDRLGEIIRGAPLEGPPVFHLIRRALQGITGQGRSLGVLPSSFNPPTTAHKALMERARTVEPIDETLLVLDKKPLDKEIAGASLEQRLLMILLCFESDPTVSIAFTNRGLFGDKLTLLKKAYPDNTMIRFIVGYDTLTRILDTKYYEDRDASLNRLFAESRFLVATRGNVDTDRIKRVVTQKENRPFAEKIVPFEMPFATRHVSSTHIRKDLSEGRKIEHLVPAAISSYLRRTGLYRIRRDSVALNQQSKWKRKITENSG
jgi:nicotinate (nicotinamide) nucleotide adenylyltransferase